MVISPGPFFFSTGTCFLWTACKENPVWGKTRFCTSEWSWPLIHHVVPDHDRTNHIVCVYTHACGCFISWQLDIYYTGARSFSPLRCISSPKQAWTFWGFFSHERRVETFLKGIHICKLLWIVSISLSLSWRCSKRAHMVNPCSCIGPSAGFIALETCKIGPIPAAAPWCVQVRPLLQKWF